MTLNMSKYELWSLHEFSAQGKPWCRKHGKKHGIHGETMVSPCFSWFPMLCKSMVKHGKHGNIFQATSAEHGLAWKPWDDQGDDLLVILNSMEKHGKHGTLLSHDFRQYEKAWGAWQLLIFMTSDGMEKHGKQGTAFLMISNRMGKHGEHGNPFFHDFR